MMKRLFSFVWLLCVVMAFSAAAGARGHFSIATTPGRLPRTVVPSDYEIAVAPNLKTFELAGRESVTLVIQRATRSIVFNTLETTIGSADLDGVRPLAIATDARAQLVTLRFANAISTGRHVLHLSYRAHMPSSPEGLFHQGYTTPSGHQTVMLCSQMESTDARRMFPSWDEPAFRARFHLTVTVPRDFTAVSNMPIERTTTLDAATKRVTFARTPSMPTYLVVFCAGKFETMAGQSRGTKINVYATEGKRESERFALDAAEKLLAFYDDYYGIKYPLPKLDLIAVPGGFGGAMENWGGITFQEGILLFDPKLEPESAKPRVFEVIAHEMSHQWNGDLVTMAWWDQLWLNEGFATWMTVKATDHFHPEWRRWLNSDQDKDRALYTDAKRTTHPIYVAVRNEAEAASVFDSISYTKGGAFLRMLETYMGPTRFRQGLHNYFRANAYSNTVAADLWDALSAQAHTDVSVLAKSWVNHPGYPLVRVATTCANGRRFARLDQRRYSYDPTSDATIWRIPMNIQPDARVQTTKPVLFARRAMTVAAGACTSPLIANGNNVGYYRVAYDAPDIALLQANFTSLSAADRINLFNDTWALARTRTSRVGDFFNYLKADAADRDPLVLDDALGVLNNIGQLEKRTPGEAAFKAYERAYLQPLLAAFGGWDGSTKDPQVVSLRMQIIGLLAEAGDPTTITEAQRRFQTFLANPHAFAPAMKDAVIGIAARYADEATYGKIIGLGMASRNPMEMQLYFRSAIGAKDDALAQKSLQMALHLPPQFASLAPFIILGVAQDHPKLAWDFLNANKDRIFAPLSTFEKIGAISRVASGFWNGIPSSEIAAFLRANTPPDAAKEIAKAMETVDLSLRTQQIVVPQVDAYVGDTAQR